MTIKNNRNLIFLIKLDLFKKIMKKSYLKNLKLQPINTKSDQFNFWFPPP